MGFEDELYVHRIADPYVCISLLRQAGIGVVVLPDPGGHAGMLQEFHLADIAVGIFSDERIEEAAVVAV